MSACPEIDALLRTDEEGRRAVAEHVATCKGCAAVLALEAFRRLPDRPDARARCDDALLDIAALADGILDREGERRLDAHLAECARCRKTAVRMALFAGDLDDVPEPVFAPAAGRVDAAREVESSGMRELADAGREVPERAREQTGRKDPAVPRARASQRWTRPVKVAAGGLAVAAAFMLLVVAGRQVMVALRPPVFDHRNAKGDPTGEATSAETSEPAGTSSAPKEPPADAGAPPRPGMKRGPGR